MNYGRPREFDAERALDAATQQFWAVGYEATSLQHLLQAMKLSKSSLYQSFGNKHDLFIRCLGHYQQLMVDDLNTRLSNSISAKQFLHEFLEHVIAEAGPNRDRKGCFLVNTANELSQRDPDVAEVVVRATNDLSNVFHRAIEQAKREKDIGSTMSTESLVDYLITAVSGLRTMVKAGAGEDSLNPVVNLIMKTLFTT